jgi:hypothetical protein
VNIQQRWLIDQPGSVVLAGEPTPFNCRCEDIAVRVQDIVDSNLKLNAEMATKILGREVKESKVSVKVVEQCLP